MDGGVTLRRGLRSVGRAVVPLQPDLRRQRRVEEAVGVRAILGVAAVDDKADVGRSWRKVHPGEAPVLVLAQERLGGGPVDGLGDVAPQVQPPVVVVVAGGVIAVVAVGAEVVDHRMIDGRRAAAASR